MKNILSALGFLLLIIFGFMAFTTKTSSVSNVQSTVMRVDGCQWVVFYGAAGIAAEHSHACDNYGMHKP